MSNRTDRDMKTNALRSVTILMTWVVLGSAGDWAVAAEEEPGVAVAIVYDTSGSMKQPVRDGNGQLSPKYVIARRALEEIVKRLQTFATNAAGGVPRRIEAGLFVFSGSRVRELVKFGPFDPKAAQDWTRDLPPPTSGTP